ncbi:MAG: hypothetical protein IT329_08900 [Caldilineaceae bacterium]|nr:hypothetical protein [Caldilineaceae bacterium]
MYTSIRRYTITAAETVEEITRRVKEGFVPIIRQTPGFVAYYLVDAGDGVVATISMFDDQAGAEESNRRAADWVKQNLAHVASDAPQVTAGQVTLHKTK